MDDLPTICCTCGQPVPCDDGPSDPAAWEAVENEWGHVQRALPRGQDAGPRRELIDHFLSPIGD